MRIPLATYRLQLSPKFGFKQAQQIVDYLVELGISDIYASPIFKAKSGSLHGYDIIDTNQLNTELGSNENFESLMKSVKSRSMGWIQDIVPNHTAYDSENKLIYDVLEKGRDSQYADFFDIKWDYTEDELDGKILAPFLGKPLSQSLKDGEIKLDYEEGKPCIRYFEKKFPVRIDSEKSGALEKILSEQFYKLEFWKETRKIINYRRFFYLNNFIALKVENEKVFDYTHRLILQLVKEKKFTGLRVDHVDGLYDPSAYLQKLRKETPDSFIVVEKILALDERLQSDWLIQGTTGYDYLNYLNNVFCRQSSEEQFTQLYENILNNHKTYQEMLFEKKKFIIENYMAGELDYLMYLLKKIINENSLFKEVQFRIFKSVMIEILAGFPVYRTYLKKQTENELITKLISSFQQLSSAVMAKGFEDTFLYNYFRFISLNEVGGDPSQFGITIERFHDFNKERFEIRPHTLNATSTHDTKRGEDVRARLNVLSEIPQLWKSKINSWMQINSDNKRNFNGEYAPDKNDEYFIYQTLVGAYPFNEDNSGTFEQRVKDYIIKSVREAKRHSNWTEPNKEYENACIDFIDKILNPSYEFLKDFLPFQKMIAHYGVFNSLSQILIKITSPGIPDFYQGSELWDFNLVDPDNRRPVDYEKRKNILNEIKNPSNIIQKLLSTKEDGKIKLFLMYKALSVRRKFPELFQKGDYQPLEVRGLFKDNIIAFARRYENQFVITITPRFFTEIVSKEQLPLGEKIWKDTTVILDSEISYELINCITGKTMTVQKNIYLAQAFEDFPVGLLSSQR